MIRRIVSASFVVALLAGGVAQAALHLEGQSGVFLNTLAYPLGRSKFEVSSHHVDLDKAGTVTTYNIAAGLKDNVEIGYTRVSSAVTGVSDQNLVLAKWQFAAEKKKFPALSIWGIYRDLDKGDNSVDLGVTATKVIGGKHPIILDLGVRNSKAKAFGLFGYADDRQWLWEGAAGVFATSKLIVATEFKQQVQSRPWRDIAVRYLASKDVNLDAGLANLGPGLDSQWAFAATYAW